MSSPDIEKLIGLPMQITLDSNSEDEYYTFNEISDNDEISDRSIEYCEPDDYEHKQKEIQQHEVFNNLIDSLQFMSLNEQQIMLYHGDTNQCIIQMEF